MNDSLLAEISILESHIKGKMAELKPYQEKLHKLHLDHRTFKSKEFIRVNNIKRHDVQENMGKEIPYFFTFNAFGEWLKTLSDRKPWAEWNGVIYRTEDVIAGRMTEMPGLVEDL